jgi:uroporphyrin-3 C-methyltransferase
MNENVEDTPPAETPAPVAPEKHRLRTWVLPGTAVALVALLAWQALDLRQRIAGAQAELERRSAADAALAIELSALQQRMAVLEAKFGEIQAQQASLDGAYQEIARGREEWLLTEIEQLLGLASQQLQLAGNVQAAAQALAAAELRLARAQRPQLIALRKAIAIDLQRLKATPGVDLAGIALRIETTAAAVDAMGLAYDSRPSSPTRAPTGKAAEAPPADPWWQRGLREFWAELRSLLRVERMDRPDPVVLAPNQVFFLRENLKLRLLSARVELLSRDQAAFRAEIKLALQWLEKHFDPRDRRVQAAIEGLRPFLAAEFSIEAPSLAGSQAALGAVKLPADRPSR